MDTSTGMTWEELSPLMERFVHESLLSSRIPFLQNIQQLVKSEALEINQLSQVSVTLLNTYSIYQDYQSKSLVGSIFGNMLELEPTLIEKYIKYILHIATTRPGNKPVVDYLNLLEWVHIFFKIVSKDTELFNANVKSLLQAHSFLTSGIETSLDNQETVMKSHEKQNQHRRRVRQSILQSTVKTFVSCFNNKANSASFLVSIGKTILDDYSSMSLPTSGVVIAMGALTQSTLQLFSSQPVLYNSLKENFVSKYSDFIGKEVIAGKNPPSPFCLEISLSPFLTEFVTEEIFTANFVPNFEKVNLRSPESGLNILHEFYGGVDSKNVNILKIHRSTKLITQCFTSLKSSKETVREIALETILGLLRACSEEITTSDDMVAVVDEIFRNIKINMNADYKTVASTILINIPTFSKDASNKIVTGLSAYISKEANEGALKNMLDAFFTHYFALNETREDINKIISNGLTEKKSALKKIWFASLLINSKQISKEIIQTFETDILEFINDSLSVHHKYNQYGIFGSFIFIDKVYDLDIVELKSKIINLMNSLPDGSLLGAAYLHVTLSISLSSTDRLKSVELLQKAFVREPELIGTSIISALENKIQESERGPEEPVFYKFITPVFNAISVQIEDIDVSSKILVRALLIAQYDKLKLKNGWAGLVQHAKRDPAAIVHKYATEIVSKITTILGDEKLINTDLGKCALKAAAYASFINPRSIVPLLSKIIENDLKTDVIAKLSNQDLTIADAAEGELVINVLEKDMDRKLAAKNSKDYETLKWEQNIRREQAKKANKKLTKEEQTLVNEQLAKESEIRANVFSIRKSLNRGVQLIRHFSEDTIQVDNGRDIWFPVAVSSLLNLIQDFNSFSLVGASAITAYLELSKDITARFGSTRIFIGLASLRVHKVSNIPENYLQEPLPELLSRVLFRVKFISDQMPLDSTSLTYLLPLLINVLEEGKRVSIINADKPLTRSEFVEEDKEEEQLLLAMEIIAVHSEVFQDPSIPRVPILNVLLSLLSLPSKAKMARECFNALSQSISVAPNEEDLKILLSSVLSANQFVRTTILEAIDNEFELEPYMKYSTEIFICRFDSHVANREVADFIWEFNKFQVNEEMIKGFFNFFKMSDSGLRLFTAQSYTSAVKQLMTTNSGSLESNLQALMNFYEDKAKPLEPIMDEFGLVIVNASERKDPWEERSTAAIALKEISLLFSEDSNEIVDIIQFLVEDGALGDRDVIVRQEMKEAGIETITRHGSKKVEELIPIFEKSLTSDTDAKIKENVIILYGSLARHLQATDPRIHTIIDRLLRTLETPSKHVQQAVSECLSPLVHLFKPKVPEYIDNLMDNLLDSKKSIHMRKGAAWGIAGLVKGYGISALSEFDIIRNLIEAAEDKRDAVRRESVAYAFEYLSKSLNKFFEPYVIEILPNILKNLGDSVPEVRDSTAEATKAIMANTTSYGVKKLIPVAVSNLDEIAWRTKRGSVELLGNMAYLDPTQLSGSLSTIIPEIVAVLNDSHKEVRKSADESLKRFGKVIRNPEIQKLVPTLIKAIGDPTKYTEEALDSLIQTQFVHYIDGPSLALIIHVIHRGMHERSANTKRKACKIVGNMAILVDTKDLIPYLQQLIDEVEIAMVDPVPNTRATAARALGALVERLGEEQFPDLIPRLLGTLSDEGKSGDRLGSAQALAEVISGLGIAKLEELLPTILDGVTNFRSFIREGFMPMLLFLPVCFGAQFAPYINQIIQPILAGLADIDESIQDTALKAGKLIVKNYATKAIDLLLPELEKGMFDQNDRIRLSSVQLSGELLFQVTGISSKNEFSEEGDYSGEITKKMVEVLGQERRDRILSALFVCRNDTSGIVRASTVDIWKALVPNTPRAVKEILPTLTGMIVVHLASPSSSLRNIAANTLGDLVRRVGGNAMSQLLPTLEESLAESSDEDARQGVCVALTALIEPSSVESLASYQDTVVNIIRKTLIDSSATVRHAAAASFDVYQDAVGKTAVDEILPYLLHMLKSDDSSEYALQGLQEIMSTKSEIIFPILIPTLLAPPIDAFRASALGSLAEVAGYALYKRLSVIINTLVDSLVELDPESDSSIIQAVEGTLDKVFLSVTDEVGLHPLLQQLMAFMKSESKEKRIVILERLPNFFENTILDYDIYTADIVSHAILSLDDEDPKIVKGNLEALSVILKKQEKSMLEKLVKPAKQSLQLTGTQGQDVSAFALPKGPSCVLPIFLHGLMYGSNDERETSALAIADIVSKTPAANLKPYVSVITGPLIRVVGERFSSDIKAAILYALNILFAKIPQFLRPFIPQLQRTFVKSLSDPTNETLRLRAAKALGTLIEYQPRVDPLVVELVTGAKQATDEGVTTAMLKALLEVVVKAGSKLNETSKNNIINLVEEEMMSSNDKLAVAYAKLIGSLSEILSVDEARSILTDKVLESGLESDSGKFGILTLNSFLKDAPFHIFETGLVNQFIEYIIKAVNSPYVYFSENGLVAAGKLLLLVDEIKSPFSKVDASSPFSLEDGAIKSLLDEISKSMLKPVCNSTDARRLSLVVVRTLARFKFEKCIEPYYNSLGPAVFSCLRDPIIPIKLAAEKAYLSIFRLVEDHEMDKFNLWFETISASGEDLTSITGATIPLRSVGDYTKRVAKRLAIVERERIAAGGDAETMYSDRFEDEREIWAVGSVELDEEESVF